VPSTLTAGGVVVTIWVIYAVLVLGRTPKKLDLVIARSVFCDEAISLHGVRDCFHYVSSRFNRIKNAVEELVSTGISINMAQNKS